MCKIARCIAQCNTGMMSHSEQRLSEQPSARQEFSAGWPSVLIAALAISVGMTGIGFYSLGLFVNPLQEEYGWSRAAVSGAATFQQLGIFLSAPVVGRLADRFGARPIAIGSFIATPLAFVALSYAGPSVAGWYALWLLISLAGCGTTPAIWARVVSSRFDKSRGLALGLMLVGTGMAAILAPAILGPVMAAYGWRSAVLAMAAVTFLVGMPVSLLLNEKEGKPAPAEKGTSGRFEMNSATLTLVAVGFLLGLIVAGLIVHLVPMLIDRSVSPTRAASIAATIGIAVIVSRVFVGYLFDRLNAPFVASVFLISPIISCLLLWLDGPVLPAAILLGIAAGVEVDMLAFFTARFAQMRNYGATYGVILGLFCFGASFGPLIFGWSVDVTGNYDIALVTSAVFLTLVVAMIASLGFQRRITQPSLA